MVVHFHELLKIHLILLFKKIIISLNKEYYQSLNENHYLFYINLLNLKKYNFHILNILCIFHH